MQLNVIDKANEGDELTFKCGVIHWTWFLTLRVGKTWGHRTVEVVRYWRIHNGDTGQPKCVKGSPTIYENRERTVVAIGLGYGIYPVDNPRYVFDYKG